MIHISVDDMNSFQHLVSLLGLMKGGQMGEEFLDFHDL